MHRLGFAASGLAILAAGVIATCVGTANPLPDESGTPSRLAGGSFEASGIAPVPGTRAFLFVDDDRPGDIFRVEFTPTGRQRGAAVRVPLPAFVTDPEGMTHDGQYFYVVGSQSKPTGSDGDGLVRFTFDPSTNRIDRLESIRNVKGWLSDHVTELSGVDRAAGDHILNIEAIAWDPTHRRLLLGLRAPLHEQRALIVPVRMRDPAGRFTRTNLQLAGPVIHLPLGGAGIRSLEFDQQRGRFTLITGAHLNDESLDFRVLDWDGNPQSAPVARTLYDRRLKPEGVARAASQDGGWLVLVFDTGWYAVTH
jgi:hypothetical protein